MKSITYVVIPYFDEDQMKQRIHATFDGSIDKRKLYRLIRSAVKQMFNITVGKEWIKAHCTIYNGDTDGAPKPVVTRDKLDEFYLKIMRETELEEANGECETEADGS